MPEVESSALDSVDYHGESRTLFIRFVSGELYAYFGVPASVYEACLTAPSKGGWFARYVRDRYPHHHVR